MLLSAAEICQSVILAAFNKKLFNCIYEFISTNPSQDKNNNKKTLTLGSNIKKLKTMEVIGELITLKKEYERK